MRKGIAIPYIIALILGIVVVAVIGYWFFVVTGGTSKQQCQGNFLSYCTQWSLAAFNPNTGLGGRTFEQVYPSCATYVAEFTAPSGSELTACQSALSVSGGATTSTTAACSHAGQACNPTEVPGALPCCGGISCPSVVGTDTCPSNTP